MIYVIRARRLVEGKDGTEQKEPAMAEAGWEIEECSLYSLSSGQYG